jgi:hypothetical protein
MNGMMGPRARQNHRSIYLLRGINVSYIVLDSTNIPFPQWREIQAASDPDRLDKSRRLFGILAWHLAGRPSALREGKDVSGLFAVLPDTACGGELQ